MVGFQAPRALGDLRIQIATDPDCVMETGTPDVVVAKTWTE